MLREADAGFVPGFQARGRTLSGMVFFVAATLLPAVVALLIVVSVDARPAEAAGNKTCNSASRLGPRCAAVGWFYPYGERMVVSDNRTDGYGAAFVYSYLSPDGQRGGRGAFIDKHNDGHPTRRDLDIPEGWTFNFRVCLSKGNTGIIWPTCSRTRSVLT